MASVTTQQGPNQPSPLHFSYASQLHNNRNHHNHPVIIQWLRWRLCYFLLGVLMFYTLPQLGPLLHNYIRAQHDWQNVWCLFKFIHWHSHKVTWSHKHRWWILQQICKPWNCIFRMNYAPLSYEHNLLLHYPRPSLHFEIRSQQLCDSFLQT